MAVTVGDKVLLPEFGGAKVNIHKVLKFGGAKLNIWYLNS